MLGNAEALAEARKKRDIFMKTYAHDEVLTHRIPELVASMMDLEFNVNISILETVPIVFVEGWRTILNFVANQDAPEFALDVGGVSIQYQTTYSESEKPTNIDPILRHIRKSVFKREDHQSVSGSSYTDNLLRSYNRWRSVYLTETVDDLESKIHAKIQKDYGISTMVPVAILPIMVAAYVAGLQIAEEEQREVNMYNIFSINVIDDTVILTPSSSIKERMKGDSKK